MVSVVGVGIAGALAVIFPEKKALFPCSSLLRRLFGTIGGWSLRRSAHFDRLA